VWNEARIINAAANLLTVLAVCALLLSSLVWFVRLSAFDFKRIEIVSSPQATFRYISPDVVRSAIAGQLYGNFFTMDLDQTREAFESAPWGAASRGSTCLAQYGASDTRRAKAARSVEREPIDEYLGRSVHGQPGRLGGRVELAAVSRSRRDRKFDRAALCRARSMVRSTGHQSSRPELDQPLCPASNALEWHHPRSRTRSWRRSPRSAGRCAGSGDIWRTRRTFCAHVAQSGASIRFSGRSTYRLALPRWFCANPGTVARFQTIQRETVKP